MAASAVGLWRTATVPLGVRDGLLRLRDLEGARKGLAYGHARRIVHGGARRTFRLRFSGASVGSFSLKSHFDGP
jgi:hypothetical protein